MYDAPHRPPPQGTAPLRIPTTRPPLVIQPPARDVSNRPSKSVSDHGPLVASSTPPAPSASSVPTLYVNLRSCQHSNDLLFDVRHVHKFDVHVVDIATEAPPRWLPGTPTFVHERSVYCGDNAFQFAAAYAPMVQETPPNGEVAASSKQRTKSSGTTISNAFRPVTYENEAAIEAKYAESTDAKLQRMMQGR